MQHGRPHPSTSRLPATAIVYGSCSAVSSAVGITGFAREPPHRRPTRLTTPITAENTIRSGLLVLAVRTTSRGAEAAGASLVYEAMTEPEQLSADLDRTTDVERQRLREDPKQEAKVWLEKITEADRMRTGYQEMAARGLMSFEELEAR